MYIQKIYDLGSIIQIENHYPGNYGAPGVKRSKKRNRTPEDIRRQNIYNRSKRIQRLIIANFRPGDWHLVLNYRGKDKPDLETSKEDLRIFLSEMRKRYRKAGIPFKYIAVTERGRKGNALHHHLIIQDIHQPVVTTKIVNEIWNHGTRYFYPLYEDGEYTDLSEYILKSEGKEDIGWESYTRSRNLIVPEPEIRKMKRRRWPEEPKPRKGFCIVKDSVVNGMNPVTGYPYQHYSQKELFTKEPSKKRAVPNVHWGRKDTEGRSHEG